MVGISLEGHSEVASAPPADLPPLLLTPTPGHLKPLPLHPGSGVQSNSVGGSWGRLGAYKAVSSFSSSQAVPHTARLGQWEQQPPKEASGGPSPPQVWSFGCLPWEEPSDHSRCVQQRAAAVQGRPRARRLRGARWCLPIAGGFLHGRKKDTDWRARQAKQPAPPGTAYLLFLHRVPHEISFDQILSSCYCSYS